ncbi:universal stress protein [Hydrocoleum sp. CS-953]|uniref:universal stress protein n=1 Tax=Microcoleaceae TaxID=1892252 RepID=UPI000B9AF7CE|nr:universal stress protein [Hydrocoleum sp. CS-953]OZH52605.1 universal stress protein UspA [Hydrocoleum sp. CS-953]
MSIFPKNSVLVPIDFSDESIEAINVALEFVADTSHLWVLHVLPHLNPVEPGVRWHTVDDQSRKQQVEKAFHEKFSAKEYEGINFSVVIGNPAPEILDYAQEKKVELIIIPSHGHTGISRFLLGSVAERVVRYSHCPVLVLRK